MHIELISDIICPWCYVGKRRLSAAINELGVEDKVDVEITPYELYPDTRLEGRPANGYKKTGDVLPVLIEAGKPIGIDFRFDLIDRIPNTLGLHAHLMSVDGGSRDTLKDAFMRAFFMEGKDLTDMDFVTSLAQSTLGENVIFDLSEDHMLKIQEKIQANRDRGIRAVPSFIINGEHIISGAVEANRWRAFFRKNLS